MTGETKKFMLYAAFGIAVVYMLNRQQSATQQAQGQSLITALATGASLAGPKMHGYGWPGYGRKWRGI
jgi:hypothetical protein